MKPTIRYFSKVINNFCKNLFGDRDYFGCIYGSRANGAMSKSSDIDIFVAIEQYSHEELQLFKNFIVSLHKKNRIPLDTEVPFDNKLFVSYKETSKAVFLCGLDIIKKSFSIPKIRKSKKFLSSMEVRRRLVFNALTSPHIFLGVDRESYIKFRTIAKKNAILLAIGLLKKPTFTLSELMGKLLVGPEGEKEDYYLGYGYNNNSVNYLRKLLSNELRSLIEDKEIGKRDGFFSLAKRSKLMSNLKNNFLELKNE